jgi:hypothetical protein
LVEADGVVDPVVLAGAYWRAARDNGAVHINEVRRPSLSSSQQVLATQWSASHQRGTLHVV